LGNKYGQGGTPLSELFNYIDTLSGRAKYEKAAGSDAAIDLFRSTRNAAASDRNDFLGKLYSESSSPNQLTWKNAFDNYHSNIDAINNFQQMFHEPQAREVLVKRLSEAPTAQKLEMLDNIKRSGGR
jgi:hypothetical protein